MACHSFPVERHRSSVKHLWARPAAVGLVLVTVLGGCSRTVTQSQLQPDPRATAIASVQDYLAGEHAAIWAYGRAAALLPKPELTLAVKTMARHKRERDRLERELRTSGITPVGALVAYDEGAPLTNAAQARTFLAGVETRLKTLALAMKNIPSKAQNKQQ